MAALLTKDYENWAGTQKGSAANEKSNTEFFEGRGKNIQLKDEEIGIIFLTPKVAIYKSRDETTKLTGLMKKENHCRQTKDCTLLYM
jgi:hypothetical protein